MSTIRGTVILALLGSRSTGPKATAPLGLPGEGRGTLNVSPALICRQFP